MKLDKLSESILRELRSDDGSTSLICAFDEAWTFDSNLTISQLAACCECSEESILPCIDFLKSQGYIEFKFISAKNQSIPATFFLTHTGLHYLEFIRLEKKEAFQKSFLYPCLVSFATAAITSITWPSVWSELTALLKWLWLLT